MNTTAAASSLPPGALAGVRVLDLSRVLAGPWCTQTLADLGADVIKIERPPTARHPGGDDTRRWGPPYLKDDAGTDTTEAAYFLGTNRNKRSVAIDLAHPEGQALIKQLALQADVLVENFKVGDLARYGLGPEDMAQIHPRLVYCSITGYGQDGPYRERAGYDYAIQGLGGLMSVTGERDDLPGGGPQKVGVAVADLFTGMYATVAILAALRHRDLTGQGQAIDMALLDAQVAMLANLSANYLCSGQAPKRMGNAHPNIVPYQVFQASDGFFIVAVGNDGQFAKLCELVGHPEWAIDPRFATNSARVKHRDELTPMLAAVFPAHPRQHWLEAMHAAQVPGNPIQDLQELFEDPHVQARGLVEHIPHPLSDQLKLVGSPIKLSQTPTRTHRAPPLLGQHTDEVLHALGHAPEQIERWRRDGVVG
ncbi:CaiB/BaiF CoA transferase family protein [Roseateles sp. BYS180W]|uniref:CaiB/BaiF CoA transferase family protein n=1 Tax=Roseateles rivi TaxID=3299028 RepID=A0ABW7FUQ1_9BURK